MNHRNQCLALFAVVLLITACDFKLGSSHDDDLEGHETPGGLSLHAKSSHHSETGTGSAGHGAAHGSSHGAMSSQGYLAAITPVVTTPVIPQCKAQRNAPRGQLAASYFEEMQACAATLPPQLAEASDAGRLDENGDCNLGTVGATEVVCHYHPSYEFTSTTRVPADPNTLEIHCIAFKLEGKERILTPIVFGTQLSCKAGTLPGSSHGSSHGGGHLAASSHGGGHDGHLPAANACGSRIPEVFQTADSCDMRCCRDGTLTKANPGMAVRPSFAICANPVINVDCNAVLAGMHAHPAHRPHDKVGPKELYPNVRLSREFGAPQTEQRPKKDRIKDVAAPAEDPYW